MSNQNQETTMTPETQEATSEPQETQDTPGQPRRTRKRSGEPPAPAQERQPLHDSVTRLADLAREIELRFARLAALNDEGRAIAHELGPLQADYERQVRDHATMINALCPSTGSMRVRLGGDIEEEP